MLKKISMICATSLLVSCASNQYIIDPKVLLIQRTTMLIKWNVLQNKNGILAHHFSALKSGIPGAIVSGGLAYAGLTSGNISVQNSAIIGAGGGVVTGGIFAGGNTYSTRKEIVRKCMEGRGQYSKMTDDFIKIPKTLLYEMT